MKIQNHTKKDLKLAFWELVNEDDINKIGSLEIKKNDTFNGEIPPNNFVIEEIEEEER